MIGGVLYRVCGACLRAKPLKNFERVGKSWKNACRECGALPPEAAAAVLRDSRAEIGASRRVPASLSIGAALDAREGAVQEAIVSPGFRRSAATIAAARRDHAALAAARAVSSAAAAARDASP